MQVVVISELPKTRETLLLRVLGKGRVRQDALRELRMLPEDAWEKKLAHPWLIQVGLEVPVDELLAPEDREVVMDIQAWYKNFIETHDREVEARVSRDIEARVSRDVEARVSRDVEARVSREVEPRIADARRQERVSQLVHLFERRIGRKMTTDECDALAAQVKTHGSEHLADLVLDLSGQELAAWLEKNGTARND